MCCSCMYYTKCIYLSQAETQDLVILIKMKTFRAQVRTAIIHYCVKKSMDNLAKRKARKCEKPGFSK